MEKQNLYKKRTKELRERFGDVASEYEMYRFEYPIELYNCIFSYSSEGKEALEIGIGTGKATLPILEKNYEVTAVEPVKRMLEIARKKYNGKNITFINTTFEELKYGKQYDLIYAASSFQWINGCDRLKKVFDLLKDGGTFARFKTINIIDATKHTNNQILIDIYLKYLPDYLPSDMDRKHMSDEEYVQFGFCNMERHEYLINHICEVDRYIQFINTYTEYISLSNEIKHKFENAINNELSGKQIVITQKCSLFLAKKHGE